MTLTPKEIALLSIPPDTILGFSADAIPSEISGLVKKHFLHEVYRKYAVGNRAPILYCYAVTEAGALALKYIQSESAKASEVAKTVTHDGVWGPEQVGEYLTPSTSDRFQKDMAVMANRLQTTLYELAKVHKAIDAHELAIATLQKSKASHNDVNDLLSAVRVSASTLTRDATLTACAEIVERYRAKAPLLASERRTLAEISSEFEQLRGKC